MEKSRHVGNGMECNGKHECQFKLTLAEYGLNNEFNLSNLSQYLRIAWCYFEFGKRINFLKIDQL